ncbi:MAG: zinc ribbon domain-containing protein [Ignavibacteriales bacterium]|nr:zinc ribbon domain-containing protein [Ignavibacteriales bacterium]
MPTYHYRCKKCTHEFEEIQRITAPPLKKCPECKTQNLGRVIGTGTGFVFTGSGYYLTDYKKTSEKPVVKEEPLSTPEKKSETKTPKEKPKSKPAEK